MEHFDNYIGSERGANDRHTELMSVLREIRDLIRNKDLGDTTSAQKAKREADRQTLQGNLSDLFGPSSVVFKAKAPLCEAVRKAAAVFNNAGLTRVALLVTERDHKRFVDELNIGNPEPSRVGFTHASVMTCIGPVAVELSEANFPLFRTTPAGCPDPTPRGIEVIIHDEPMNCSPAFLAQAIMRLNPTRVFVDTGATGKLVLQLLRDNGVAAEPLPRQTSHLSAQTYGAPCPMDDFQQSSGSREQQRIGLGGQPR